MDTVKSVIRILTEYNGTSLFFLLFIAALIYLAVSEKAGAKRLLLFWLPVLIFAFIAFPVTAWISFHYILDTEIFYRQLWLVPYAAVVAYAVVKLSSKMKKKRTKVLVVTAAALLMFIGNGKGNVFFNGSLTPSANAYHLPEEAIEVYDIILAQKKPVELQSPPRTGLPMSLVEFNRQYTTDFVSAYGRESIIARWNLTHPFLKVITNEEEITAKEICEAANSDMIECFVLERWRPVTGNFEDYNYVNIGNTENYSVYMMKWMANE